MTLTRGPYHGALLNVFPSLTHPVYTAPVLRRSPQQASYIEHRFLKTTHRTPTDALRTDRSNHIAPLTVLFYVYVFLFNTFTFPFGLALTPHDKFHTLHVTPCSVRCVEA